MAARTQAEAEFLARELAAVRLALAGMATADDVSSSLNRLESLLITGGARDNAGGLSAANLRTPSAPPVVRRTAKSQAPAAQPK